MYIVAYRPHGCLMIETKFYGPFYDIATASAMLERIPALGCCADDETKGVKYITVLEEGF